MENTERKINITYNIARLWYHSEDSTLKKLALSAFTKEELENDYKSIQTFEDAYKFLGFTTKEIKDILHNLNQISKASAAMFQLNIIRKALNYDQELSLVKGEIYYPYVPISTETSTWYDSDILDKSIKQIGKFMYQGKVYKFYGGHAISSGITGLSKFNPQDGIGTADCNLAFLGCATREIAEHFGKYFGDIIIRAKYNDLPSFMML